MAGDETEAHGRTERESGPRTWLVLLLTAVLGSALVGGGAFVAHRIGSNDESSAPSTAFAATTTLPDEVSSPTKLFERTTEAGISLRVFRSDAAPIWGPGFQGADLPDRCVMDGTVQLTALGKAGVATLQGNTTKAAPEKGNVTYTVGGVIEGDPILAFVVQAPDGVTAVGASAAGGGTDTMEPVDGIAALAMKAPDDLARMMTGIGGPVAGNADPWRGILIDLRHADGTVTRLSGNDLQQGMAMWSDPVCNGQQPVDPNVPVETFPPPTLPPGNGEAPPDPAAAKRDIKHAMAAVYATGQSTDAARVENIDDPSGIQFMLDRVRKDPNGRLLEPDSVAITEIGFLSAVEASFFYDLVLPTGEQYLQQYGRARFIDGAWKITRATICLDWQKVGAGCGP